MRYRERGRWSMKDGFRQNVLGILMLFAVTAVFFHGGGRIESGKNGFSAQDRAVFQVSRQNTESLQTREAKKARVIILDAGHGGPDPGKIGAEGQLEKDINLEIVYRIKGYLEANDVTVALTRQKDEGLHSAGDKNKKTADMRKRIEIINGTAPEAMVSIHQNSYHGPEISGPQVFYYQNSEEGKEFARLMQKRFDYVLGAGNRRQAKANGNYYLLTHSRPVSIIVETGFLSNPEEARKLETEEYQDRVAWTVAMGILQYMNQKETM